VTYNRKKFIPSLLESVNNQLYSKHYIELIIVDDGVENSEEFMRENKFPFPIKYYTLEKKNEIG
jgi:glycosyltransferase involved in cell wall biosynthesis